MPIARRAQRASHGSGAGLPGPRERACKGVRGTKSPGMAMDDFSLEFLNICERNFT